MLFNNAVADGETEPQPFSNRLGRDEGIENAFDQFWWNARSIVGDADAHRIVRRAHRDLNMVLMTRSSLPGDCGAIGSAVDLVRQWCGAAKRAFGHIRCLRLYRFTGSRP